MRYIEEMILKSLEDDIKELKKECNINEKYWRKNFKRIRGRY